MPVAPLLNHVSIVARDLVYRRMKEPGALDHVTVGNAIVATARARG